MSDAIQQAIEAMDMARSAVGPFGVVVTKKLTNAIEALQALQSGEPVTAALINKWIKEIRADCAMYGDDAHTETIARYVADRALKHTTPQPVVPEWIEGAPKVETYAILHVPCKGYPGYCVIGCLEDDGAVYDMCGDEVGVYEDDIERWTKLPALLSAGKENNNE
jgi:hypothetical protein